MSKPSQEAYQNELNIESVERSFILSARSAVHLLILKLLNVARLLLMVLSFATHSAATERDEWLEAIAKAIDDYTKKKTTFISSRSQEEVKPKRPTLLAHP